MKRVNRLLRLLPALLALTLSVPASAGAPLLDIPKAVKGDRCVEDTDEMRRNHMDYLKHHRDDTLRRGIRTQKYSLAQCLECHVAPAEEAKTTGHDGKHFCRSCHEYAAVHIDCFECHNTRPEKSTRFDPLASPTQNAHGGTPSSATADQPGRLAATTTATGAAR